MNNTITAINFQEKSKAPLRKVEAKDQNVKASLKEEDVKNIIQKTTTPGMRKVVLGIASFAAVMFATRRLAVTPIRSILFKIPKINNAVENFTKSAKPFLGTVGSRLGEETKKFINGENFSGFVKKVIKNEKAANKLISKTYKITKFLGDKAARLAKYGLANPGKVIDYTLTGTVAALSSKGVIKLNNLSSKKKLENLFGDDKDKAKGKE